jgi:ribosomal-protein-alanine N-acetyltransferase
VRLREPRTRDEDEFLKLNRESRRFHRGWVSPPVTSADFRTFLLRAREGSVETRLICRRTDGAILGAFSLSQIARGNFQSAYLGYYIGSRHAGQGYMGEALTLALRLAFGSLRLNRIEANIQPENAPSIALVRRAGFTLEGFSRRYLKISGRWRDHQRWAILADDWRRRPVQSSSTGG